MALLVNISGKYSVPRIRSQIYGYESFDPKMTLKLQSGEVKSVDVTDIATKAWNSVVQSAAKSTPCNDYFRTLRRGQTLEQVLREGDIKLHLLVPIKGHVYSDLPWANSAGRDIGIHPELLLSERSLGCTLIHELAHVAGASTDPDAKSAEAAEQALLKCGCKDKYQPGTLGLLRLQSHSRIA